MCGHDPNGRARIRLDHKCNRQCLGSCSFGTHPMRRRVLEFPKANCKVSTKMHWMESGGDTKSPPPRRKNPKIFERFLGRPQCYPKTSCHHCAVSNAASDVRPPQTDVRGATTDSEDTATELSYCLILASKSSLLISNEEDSTRHLLVSQ